MGEQGYTIESVLSTIDGSGMSTEEKREAVGLLIGKGVLQNLPSTEFNDDQVTDLIRNLTEQGISPEGVVNEQGRIPLPAPAPGLETVATPEALAASAPVSAPVGGATPTAAPPPEVSPPVPAGGTPQTSGTQSMYDKLVALGQSAMGGLGQAGQIASDMTGFGDAVQAAQSPEVLSDFVAPNIGEMGGTAAGALGGGAIGGAMAGPPGMAIGAFAGGLLGGAGGSAAGLYAGRKATGEPVGVEELILEAGASMVPEFLESSVKGVTRWLTKQGKDAKQIVGGLIAERAAIDAPAIYDPPAKESVNKLFDLVHQAGDRINGDDLQLSLKGFPEEVWSRTMRKIKGVTSKRQGVEGAEQVAETLNTIRKGGQGVELRLGAVQDLRSQLYKTLQPDRDGNLIGEDNLAKLDLVEAIDDSIDTLLESGKGSAKLLKQAREQWGRLKASETMSKLVTSSPVSKMDETGELVSFDLGKLRELVMDNRTVKDPMRKKIMKDLASIPGAKDELTKWLDRMQTIKGNIDVSTTGMQMQGLMAVPAMLGNVLSSIQGRKAIEKMVTSTPGPLSQQQIAIAFNAARRGYEVKEDTKDPSAAIFDSGAGYLKNKLEMVY